jgi:hypothetical protein
MASCGIDEIDIFLPGPVPDSTALHNIAGTGPGRINYTGIKKSALRAMIGSL